MTNDLITRDDWVRVTRSLVDPALTFRSADGSGLDLPGPPSNHGVGADRLEAFARVLLMESLGTCQDLSISPATTMLLEAIANGAAGGWVRAGSTPHVLVEAPSICLALWVGDRRLWNALGTPTREHVIRWLGECLDTARPWDNNWVMFPFAISRFLDAVGAPHRLRDRIEADTHDHLADRYRGDGWFSDGPGNTFDYYTSYAFHFYPGLVGVLSGDVALMGGAATRLREFLAPLTSLIAADGSPVYFGRSMIYRMAIAAPMAIARLLGVEEPGIRAVHARVVTRALDAVPDHRPLPPLWSAAQPRLGQAYSGPGAAYWAAKSLTHLLLPAEHPTWQRDAHDAATLTGRFAVPNLLVAATPDRATVRLINHGSYDVTATDIRADPDDPYYGHLGYSSVTTPLTPDTGHAEMSFTVLGLRRQFRRSRIRAEGGGAEWATSLGWMRSNRTARDAPVPARFCTIVAGGWDVHLLAVPRWARLRPVRATGWSVPLESFERTALVGLLGFPLRRSSVSVGSGGGARRHRWREVWSARGIYAVAVSLDRSRADAVPVLRRIGRRQWALTATSGVHLITIDPDGFHVRMDGDAS